MFCNKCGNRNPLNSHFCRHCGARLDIPGAVTHISDDTYRVATESVHHVFDEAKVQHLLDRAFDLSEQGDIVGAIMACREALAENPESVSGHSFLGLLYERQGEKEKAILQYEKVLELNPESTVDRENLYRLRTAMHPSQSSEKLLLPGVVSSFWSRWSQGGLYGSPYVRVLPVVATAMASVLFILLVNYAFSRPAGSSPTSEMDVTSSAAKTYLKKGREAWIEGDYDLAEKSFKSALLLSPSDSDASYLLARLDEMRNSQKVATAPSPPMSSPTPPTASPPPSPPAAPVSQPGTGNSTTDQVSSSPTRPSASGPAVRFPNGNGTRGSLPPSPSSVWVAERADRSGAGTSAETAPKPESAFSPSNNDRRPTRETRLTYKVTQVPADETNSTAPPTTDPNGANPNGDASADDNDGSGFYYQRQGFRLHRQRRYGEAKSAFLKAAQSYRQQKEAGIRVREAEEGIKTCETAVKRCNEWLR